MSDNYDITEKEIGRGAFSAVYEGIVRATNEIVAIKIIKNESMQSEADIELLKTQIGLMKLCKFSKKIILIIF